MIHPSEFAYAFAYARAESVIGWGAGPFQPAGPRDADRAEWFRGGVERLTAAGRLVGTPGAGMTFTDEMTSAVLALVDPGIVLMAQRKAGDGVRTQTVHARGGDFIGLTRTAGGDFDMERYADLTAAAVASAAFVGASPAPLGTDTRIETDQETLAELKQLVGAGGTDRLAAALERLGAPGPEARSAGLALASPAAAGVLSVLYCRSNAVEDAEAFSVMTNAADETWVLFAPAGPAGPVFLERSSAAALAARVAVGIAARLSASG